MTVRNLTDADLALLPSDGFRCSGPNIEAALVIANAEGNPILACSAERTVDIHMVCGQASPGVKLAAMRMMHEAMGAELRRLGYAEGQGFIENPRFGRRLERLFGWRRALPAWVVKL